MGLAPPWPRIHYCMQLHAQLHRLFATVTRAIVASAAIVEYCCHATLTSPFQASLQQKCSSRRAEPQLVHKLLLCMLRIARSGDERVSQNLRDAPKFAGCTKISGAEPTHPATTGHDACGRGAALPRAPSTMSAFKLLGPNVLQQQVKRSHSHSEAVRQSTSLTTKRCRMVDNAWS